MSEIQVVSQTFKTKELFLILFFQMTCEIQENVFKSICQVNISKLLEIQTQKEKEIIMLCLENTVHMGEHGKQMPYQAVSEVITNFKTFDYDKKKRC